jgi:hypothetical protein
VNRRSPFDFAQGRLCTTLRSVEKHFQEGVVGGERKLQIPRLPPDFLSGLVVSVNRMRLSLEKAAYVVVFESSEVGNRESAHPDFLWSLLALANLMRLSLLKAAHAVMAGSHVDDKGEGSAHLGSRYRGMDRAAAAYLRFSSRGVGRRPITPLRSHGKPGQAA